MTNIFIILFSILGSAITYYWAVRYKQSPVLTSAASSLVAGLILYACQTWLGATVSKSLSLAFFGGSFVGMSAETVMKKVHYALLAGFIFGLVYVGGLPLFVGYGGGLGFRATLSVLIVLGIQFIATKTPTK